MEPIKINMGCWVGVYTCPNKDCCLWSNEEEAIRRHLRSKQPHRPLREKFGNHDPDWELDHECIMKKEKKIKELQEKDKPPVSPYMIPSTITKGSDDHILALIDEATKQGDEFVKTIDKELIPKIVSTMFFKELENRGLTIKYPELYALLYYLSYMSFYKYDNMILAMRVINWFAATRRLLHHQAIEVLHDIIKKSRNTICQKFPVLKEYIWKNLRKIDESEPSSFPNKLTDLCRIR